MRFQILKKIGSDDIPPIANAVISVDPDAKVGADVQGDIVEVDSWLFAEEFLVAFDEAGYDVRITQR